MVRASKEKGSRYYQEREKNLNTGKCQGVYLYNYVRELADKLIKNSISDL